MSSKPEIKQIINQTNQANQAETKTNFLVNNGQQVFLQSKAINIFPCSRRGQAGMEGFANFYDPEARLNTERTNRLHTAVNGFTDSFIDSYNDNTLVFVLAGYYIEVKNFVPNNLPTVLNATDAATIYAQLYLQSKVPLPIGNPDSYYTDILYRQLQLSTNKNSLDTVYTYKGAAEQELTDTFFVGVSFTAEPPTDDRTDTLTPYSLLLFQKDADGIWKTAQTSMLPKIEHGETEDSIKITGDLTVAQTIKASKQIETPKLCVNSIIAHEPSGAIKVESGIILDKTLDVIGKATLHDELTARDMAVAGKTTTDTLEVTNAATVKQTLNVSSGDTNKPAIAKIDKANIDKADINEADINEAIFEHTDTTTADVTTVNASTLNTHTANVDKVIANEIWLEDTTADIIGQVPALEVGHFPGTNIYKLHFKFKTSPIVEDDPDSPTPQPPSSDDIQPVVNTVLTDKYGYILTDSNDLVLTISVD